MSMVIPVNKNIYSHIYNDYSARIQSGQLQAGKKIPSESQLAAAYSTSRETVRKALQMLSENGYIHKIKGKGSFVLDTQRLNFPVSGLISFKEVADQLGRTIRTIVYENSLVPCSSSVSQRLLIRENEPVWKVVRAREIEGEKIILDKDYFLPSVVPSIPAAAAEDSIYEYLEGKLHLRISYAKKEISVEEVTSEDRLLLDLHDYQHIVVVRNYVHLVDTQLFQYTESRHRLDKFQFVDFARRAQMEGNPL
ncbi:GntR family transcriptional regulator, trehalose operon transcriptional repressor [Paenibacillus jilunlii]|uniref:Trehalose operon repressor n=1 Tax=Paenibacillus jilunlii TaxID=682956 RepID=A0A1G9KK22_9BACL|nr:GntR family transcriptional regulator, trehalose operon transcriptional repressor [Paenibacillus jilunlii]